MKRLFLFPFIFLFFIKKILSFTQLSNVVLPSKFSKELAFLLLNVLFY